MEILYPKDFRIEDYKDKFLWRYIDLFKLIDLLNNEHVYFTRFDHFEDGLEGITEKGIALKALTLNEPLTTENINDFDRKTQEELIRRDKHLRLKYKKGLDDLETSQQTQFASCWYLGDKESMAMWKLYSKDAGVAIKYNAAQLIESILVTASNYTKSDFKRFYFGPVVYKNIWPWDFKEKFDQPFNGLKKDKSYIHENEFRFVSTVNNENKRKYNSFVLPLGKLKSYDMNIISNPFMEKWEIQNLKALLVKYDMQQSLKSSEILMNIE